MKTNLKIALVIGQRVLLPMSCFTLGLVLGSLPAAPSGFSWLRVIELSGWGIYGGIIAWHVAQEAEQ